MYINCNVVHIGYVYIYVECDFAMLNVDVFSAMTLLHTNFVNILEDMTMTMMPQMGPKHVHVVAEK